MGFHDERIVPVLIDFACATKPVLKQREKVVPRAERRLLFAEHGVAPDEAVRRWQDRIDPIWRRLLGGCNVNRDVPRLLTDAGFRIDELDTMYLPGTPKIAAFQYWGVATGR